MSKKYLSIFIFLTFLFLAENVVYADAIPPISIEEIHTTKIVGKSSIEGIIIVKENNIIIGKGLVRNGNFSINFNKKIKQTKLIISLTNTDQVYRPKTITYAPPKIQNVNDKQKIIKGTYIPGAKISSLIDSSSLPLRYINSKKGIFEFLPSNQLKKGVKFHVISEKNGIKSIFDGVVMAAPPPNKPMVNPVSNKSTFISGSGEANSTVNVFINGKSSYISTVSASGTYRINLMNKVSLRAGTKVSVFLVDTLGRKSSPVNLNVSDKVPPPAPKVNTVTDKSFSINGTTEPNATVYFKRNKVHFKAIKANSKGKFILRIPQHDSKYFFEVYSKDSAKNKSKNTKVTIKKQSRAKSKLLYVPIVRQMPELPRGCEVTSLSMLLGHTGVNVSKMTLAFQVKKDPTPYRVLNGKTYFGNPHNGFVGNMYTFSKPGFGVYNKPIASLANKYIPGRVVNLTGNSFDTVLDYVSAGKPVWVITTSWFSYVPKQYWKTWYTPTGPVRITMKEHSVVITGYDKNFVYFNDPLDGQKNKKKPLKQFIEGWNQFGNQAISYY